MTALATSAMRAVHTRLASPPLIDDPWGDRLMLDSDRELLRAVALASLDDASRESAEQVSSPEELVDLLTRANPMYGWVIVRQRYAEDALEAAVARGARQYVVVGAGMDSFALRRPDFARDVEVVEVDHPATQELKRERLAAAGVAIPSALHLVAADLSREPLDAALERSGFRDDRQAFFSWLGVSTYLTREANLATLRAIAGCATGGSELVFTYIDQRELDAHSGSAGVEQTRAAVASVGEPWVSGFDPDRLADDLAAVGLTVVEDLSGEQLSERYGAGRDDGLTASSAMHAARVRVAG